jgi:uncharacterized protein
MRLNIPNLRENKLSAAFVILILLVMGGIGYTVYESNRVHTLVLAAGGRDGESYILGTALAQVVERHYPRIKVVVLETGGTSDNLALLADGHAQLAAAQADLPAGQAARLIAVLFRDDLQLFVRNDAHVQQFQDLRGKRIGLSKGGGQYQSFLAVANHFGLSAADFQFVGEDAGSADRALLDKRADAVFRVRVLGNPALEKLTQTGIGHFVPIEPEGAAMKIRNPAFEASVIPQGVYSGTPPQPPNDVPTISVPRMFLARQDARPSDIYAITTALFDDRQEITELIPKEVTGVKFLVAGVKQGKELGGLSPPVHPGAQKFFDRDKPSFVLEHSNFVGLMLTLCVITLSWLRELKRRMEKRRKDEGIRYTEEVIQLMKIGQRSNSIITLEAVRSQLVIVLTEAVQSLDLEKISESSFQSFRTVWQIALDLLREREAALLQKEKEGDETFPSQVAEES